MSIGMQLELGLTAGVYNLLPRPLMNVIEKVGLNDTRQLEEDGAFDGTPWFNIQGRKKDVYEMNFTEEDETTENIFNLLMQYSIPDYYLPIFAKFTIPTTNSNYSTKIAYEGAVLIKMTQKEIADIPTLRNFTLTVYALQS